MQLTTNATCAKKKQGNFMPHLSGYLKNGYMCFFYQCTVSRTPQNSDMPQFMMCRDESQSTIAKSLLEFCLHTIFTAQVVLDVLIASVFEVVEHWIKLDPVPHPQG
jgi:hypothetical protein